MNAAGQLTASIAALHPLVCSGLQGQAHSPHRATPKLDWLPISVARDQDAVRRDLPPLASQSAKRLGGRLALGAPAISKRSSSQQAAAPRPARMAAVAALGACTHA